MKKFYVHLRDLNKPLINAWQREFEGVDGVKVSHGDIFYNKTDMQTISVGDPFDVHADAIVSPANSFGFMDGGIDAVYTHHFGRVVQERVQERIQKNYGELLVGQAIIVETDNLDIPFCISAPTMRTPADVSRSMNAFLAFTAVLTAVAHHNLRAEGAGAWSNEPLAGRLIETVLCPGLATSVGGMPPERCARQMRAAWTRVIEGRAIFPATIKAASLEERELLR